MYRDEGDIGVANIFMAEERKEVLDFSASFDTAVSHTFNILKLVWIERNTSLKTNVVKWRSKWSFFVYIVPAWMCVHVYININSLTQDILISIMAIFKQILIKLRT